MASRGRLTVLAGLLAGLGLAACGSGEPTATATGPTTSTTSTSTAPTTAAAPAESSTTAPAIEVPDYLDFVAPDVRGGQVTGAELAGQDLVIWFWAPW